MKSVAHIETGADPLGENAAPVQKGPSFLTQTAEASVTARPDARVEPNSAGLARCSRPSCTGETCRYRCPSGACALDVAEAHGGCTLDVAGLHMGTCRERARQVEAGALLKLAQRFEAAGIDLSAFEGVSTRPAEPTRHRRTPAGIAEPTKGERAAASAAERQRWDALWHALAKRRAVEHRDTENQINDGSAVPEGDPNE
jgi:hypothetical protein